MSHDDIKRSLKVWSSTLTPQVSEEHYDGLQAIPFSTSWSTLPRATTLKYTLLFTAKSHCLWNHTTLAALAYFLATFLELDPLYTAQHTLEDCLMALYAIPYTNDMAWEAWLRRSPEAEVAHIAPEQYWFYMIHPKFKVNFKQIVFYFAHMDDESRKTVASSSTILFKDTMECMDQWLNRMEFGENFSLVHQNTQQTRGWLRTVLNRLETFVFHSSYYKNLFVRPVFRMRTKNISLMNLSSTVCVMRRFSSADHLAMDLKTLQRQALIKTLINQGLWSDRMEYYLVEETCLVVQLMLDYYLSIHPLTNYRQQLFIFPRTATTCYLVGSATALRILRYSQLHQLDITSRKNDLNQQHRYRTTIIEQPPVFPVRVRTWNECIDHRNGNYTMEQAIGLWQMILTIIRQCYLNGHKHLTEQWYINTSPTENYYYHHLVWDEERITRSILSLDDPSRFVLFYRQFFTLLATGWRSPFAVRKAIMEAKFNQPNMNDTTVTGGSIFNFVESFVFVRAPHMLRVETIDWLQTKSIPTFPAGERLLHTLLLLKGSEACKGQWVSIHNQMLIECYYVLCTLPQWSEEEARRLLLTFRLEPVPISSALSASQQPQQQEPDEEEEEEEESTFSQVPSQQEEIMDWSSNNIDNILKALNTDSSNDESSFDVTSIIEDYDSDDAFSYSSVDEDSNDTAPVVHLNVGVSLGKRKRKSSASTLRKRRRRYPESTPNTPILEEDKQSANKHQRRWNIFNQMLTQHEIPTSTQANTFAFIPTSLMDSQVLLPWQIEFFAALEDALHQKNLTLDERRITEIVIMNQKFLPTFQSSINNYIVFFGRDNFHKLLNVQSKWFTSQNYMQIVWEKIAQIRSFQFQQFAQEILSKLNCRFYFDSEVLYIPAVINRSISSYGMQTKQRQLLEYTLEYIPRVLVSHPDPTLDDTMDIDHILMPPPPSVKSTIKDKKQPKKQQRELKFYSFAPPS